jgi:hypothetical protein
MLTIGRFQFEKEEGKHNRDGAFAANGLPAFITAWLTAKPATASPEAALTL